MKLPHRWGVRAAVNRLSPVNVGTSRLACFLVCPPRFLGAPTDKGHPEEGSCHHTPQGPVKQPSRSALNCCSHTAPKDLPRRRSTPSNTHWYARSRIGVTILCVPLCPLKLGTSPTASPSAEAFNSSPCRRKRVRPLLMHRSRSNFLSLGQTSHSTVKGLTSAGGGRNETHCMQTRPNETLDL